MKTTRKLLSLLLLILWSYNASSYTLTYPIPPPPPTANSDPIQAEKDEMLSLAVLQMVYKDWQASATGRRGHNIGSILVDKNSVPVFWARNAVTVLDDSSQHGEVRTIQSFLNCPGIGRYVDGYSVYTTLEPCAMCTGMMAMTKVQNVIYVQEDPEYGGAPEALKIITFPRQFNTYTPIGLPQKTALEQGWSDYKVGKIPEPSITDYLRSDGAKNIYDSAGLSLSGYVIKHSVNELLKTKILAFMKKVTRETYNKAMLARCPKRMR